MKLTAIAARRGTGEVCQLVDNVDEDFWEWSAENKGGFESRDSFTGLGIPCLSNVERIACWNDLSRELLSKAVEGGWCECCSTVFLFEVVGREGP